VTQVSDHKVIVSVLGPVIARLFGGVWPHKQVAKPANLISAPPLTASELRVDAVSSPTVSRSSGNTGSANDGASRTCVEATLTRNAAAGAAFAGAVTGEWMSSGTLVKAFVESRSTKRHQN